MSEQKTERRFSGWWIVALLAVVVVAALVVPALLNRSAPDSEMATTMTPLPPTPTVFPTPTAGATADVESPPPVEVGTDEVGDLSGEVHARVDKLEAVQGEGDPGEISGPAIRVTITITNDGDDPVSLAGAAVNMSYGAEDRPAPPVSRPGVVEFSGSVPAGGSATGVYVFSASESDREDIRIWLDVSAKMPMIVFKGVGPE